VAAGGMVSHPLHNSVTEHCRPQAVQPPDRLAYSTRDDRRESRVPRRLASKEADRSCGDGASRVVGAGRALAGRSPKAVGLGA